jgi:hypothetical protein
MADTPLTGDLLHNIINSPEFGTLNMSYANKTGQEPGRTQREVAQQVANTFYREDGTPKNSNKMSKKAGSPLAKFLEKMGVRPEGAKYPVGATPKKGE